MPEPHKIAIKGAYYGQVDRVQVFIPEKYTLAGGETTATIQGNGKGGQNQEMARSFLRELEPAPWH